MMNNSILTRRDIASLTAKAFDYTLAELSSNTRYYKFCRARFAVWHLVKELKPQTSLPQLGNLLCRDHTTVIHGLVRARELIDIDADFRDRLDKARNLIREWPNSRQIEPETAKEQLTAPVLAKITETPPQAKSGAEASNPCSLEMRSAGFEYDNWFRLSCKNSEDRFLAIARAVHPERVREFSGGAVE